jgi:tetratricopeptide (TPR) repeat protein
VLEGAAFAAISDSIRKAPSDANLYYRRGILLYEKQETALAQKDIEKAWSLSPREEYALSLANLLKEKNKDTAIAFLHSAIKVRPESIGLKVTLAAIFFETGAHSKALSILEPIIAAYPGQLDALILKADILADTGKGAEATEVLEAAYALAPSDADLAHSLGFRWAEAKNPKALKLADSLIRADVRGTHPEPYLLRGIYYTATNEPTLALKAFDEAIVKDYNFLDAHMYKGELLFNLKRYAEGAKTFKLATTISPTFAEGYYWLAKCEQAMGLTKEAKENFARAYHFDTSLVDRSSPLP